MRKLNILLIGGNRSVALAKAIIKIGEIVRREINLYVYGVNDNAPIVSVASLVDSANGADTLDYIHSIVNNLGIEIIIPCNNMGCRVVSDYHRRFNNETWISTCNWQSIDRVSAIDRLIAAGLPTIRRYHRGRPQLPIMAMPRYTTTPRHVEIIDTPRDFRRVIAHKNELLIAHFPVNFDRIEVDCFVTKKGKSICIVPRLDLSLNPDLSTDSTMTFFSENIISLAQKAIDNLKLTGPFTINIFRDNDAENLLLISAIVPHINDNMLGSINAGANIPLYILSEALHININQCDDWTRNLTTSFYTSDIVVKAPDSH